MEVQVGPPVVTIHFDDHVMVCESSAHMSSTEDQGFFVRDTRMVSGYRIKVGRQPPLLVNSSEVTPSTARFEFTNNDLETAGGTVPKRSLHLRLDRSLGAGVHEDYDLTNHGSSRINLEFEVSVESDFADLFDVKAGKRLRRGSIQSTWEEATATLTTRYENDSFRRGITITAFNPDSATEFANGAFVWRVDIAPGDRWHTCLLWAPDLGEGSVSPDRRCHALNGHEGNCDEPTKLWRASTTSYKTADSVVNDVVAQAVEDLASLRIHSQDPDAGSWAEGDESDSDAWVPAGGIPWFVSLFGRDALTVSLQTLSLSPRFALGALRALGRLQGDHYEDGRDMQPGKIPHEARHGELAALNLVPHTPYYGTHDATTLYVWASARAWRWHGDKSQLDSVRLHVERALAWIDQDGDMDGDGLQEYKSHARSAGYYNQGWKDSEDAIVDEEGSRASLPIALCEQQAYVVAAKRAWAEVLDEAFGESKEASKLKAEAERLSDLIEDRFWWEEEGTYYLGLDGDKKPLRSVTSNPGHLLWTGSVDPDRARRTCNRLLEDDMWSGWGIRTLSKTHPSYNPFSYQLGSVWPHDNVIAAAGFRRYGFDTEAAQVIRGIFDAAARFRSRRLPELFAGLVRDPGGFPAQYLGANVPQAWAAGAIIHAIDVLLGLDANASNSTITLRPFLPDWLPEVCLENLGIGDKRVDLTLRRRHGDGAELEVGRDDEMKIEIRDNEHPSFCTTDSATA